MPRTEPDEHSQLQVAGQMDGRPGVLTITSKRIVFSEMRGVVSKRERTHFSTPVPGIVSAHADGRALVLERRVAPHGGPLRVRIELDDPEAAARLIESLRTASTPPAAPADREVRVTIHHTGDGGATKVMLRCPYCRTVYPELDARCPSCGAPF
ncbi:MAG: hypothetical protein L3K17_07375 [Thermoplasmata archaeon]|nr:hypothetical protein [Thermoplasmata archaeon]